MSENELNYVISEFTGTVLVEAKSGYGLDTENEMKMLRVLEHAKKELPMDISSTFCGAHAVPRYWQFYINSCYFFFIGVERCIPVAIYFLNQWKSIIHSSCFSVISLHFSQRQNCSRGHVSRFKRTNTQVD